MVTSFIYFHIIVLYLGANYITIKCIKHSLLPEYNYCWYLNNLFFNVILYTDFFMIGTMHGLLDILIKLLVLHKKCSLSQFQVDYTCSYSTLKQRWMLNFDFSLVCSLSKAFAFCFPKTKWSNLTIISTSSFFMEMLKIRTFLLFKSSVWASFSSIILNILWSCFIDSSISMFIYIWLNVSSAFWEIKSPGFLYPSKS